MVESLEKINKSEKKESVRLHNYLENYSSEELLENVFNVIKTESHPPYYELYLKKLNLLVMALDEEIKNALRERIENYRIKVAELQEKIPQYIERLKSWVATNNYITKQNPESVDLYFYDKILIKGTSEIFAQLGENRFHPEFNVISVDEINLVNVNIIFHEYMHSLAFDKENKNCGFRKLGIDQMAEGNRWLDEGITVMGELETCPENFISKIFVNRDEYASYLWLVKTYMQELKISKEELFRAYFGEGNYRLLLEQKNQKRFGCSIDKLESLFIGYGPENEKIMLDIIKGKKVVLEAIEGSGVDIQYTNLKKIFSNIDLIIKPRPTFKIE
ncbi:MAG TPA: hypothetical protein PLK76_00610 [bacterium]|nr:hypothetical protein [bacterium]